MRRAGELADATPGVQRRRRLAVALRRGLPHLVQPGHCQTFPINVGFASKRRSPRSSWPIRSPRFRTPVNRVLDPFGGSGTTALTCGFLGIDSISLEVNPFLADLIAAKLTPTLPSSILSAYERFARQPQDQAGRPRGVPRHACHDAGARPEGPLGF